MSIVCEFALISVPLQLTASRRFTVSIYHFKLRQLTPCLSATFFQAEPCLPPFKKMRCFNEKTAKLQCNCGNTLYYIHDIRTSNFGAAAERSYLFYDLTLKTFLRRSQVTCDQEMYCRIISVKVFPCKH